MKRRDFITHSVPVILITGLVSCSAGMEEKQKQTTGGVSASRQAGKRNPRIKSGPTDIKSLSTILQRAGYPLTDSQINYLLTLKQGPEFNQKMNDVLDDKQIEAIKNASGGRGRGGGRRRR